MRPAGQQPLGACDAAKMSLVRVGFTPGCFYTFPSVDNEDEDAVGIVAQVVTVESTNQVTPKLDRSYYKTTLSLHSILYQGDTSDLEVCQVGYELKNVPLYMMSLSTLLDKVKKWSVTSITWKAKIGHLGLDDEDMIRADHLCSNLARAGFIVGSTAAPNLTNLLSNSSQSHDEFAENGATIRLRDILLESHVIQDQCGQLCLNPNSIEYSVNIGNPLTLREIRGSLPASALTPIELDDRLQREGGEPKALKELEAHLTPISPPIETAH